MDILGIEAQSKVVRYLPSGGDDDTMRILQFKNIRHTFESQFVKVEAIAHIVIGRYGFGIIIDHHRTPAFLTDGIECLHSAPVKLYRRTDAISTRTKHHDGTVVAQVGYIVGCAAVGQIKVIGLCRILGSKRIDLLHHGNDAQALAVIADIKASVFHITFVTDGTCYLEVRESLSLGLLKQVGRQVGYLLVIIPPLMKLLRSIHDVHQLLQEPFVDLGQVVHLVNGISRTEGLRYDEDTFVGRFMQRFVDVGDDEFFVFHKTVHTLSYHTKSFLNRFFKGTPDGHHLTDRLHRRTEFFIHSVELTEIPTGDFADYVVQRRFKERTGSLRHGVFQIEQPVSESEFGSHESKRITGSLRRQSRRTAQTGIHLDHPVIFRFGIESILHVTFAHDTDVADDADGKLTQFMIFFIGQGLRRSNHNGFSGMDAQWVEILHVADRDTVVKAVAHYFVFHLFPSPQALLNQHLRRKSERFLNKYVQFCFVVTEAGT